MEQKSGVSDIFAEVLRRVRPSADERNMLHGFVERLLVDLNKKLKDAGIEASAQIHGSVAKDTWLRGDRDLDVFIVLKRTHSRSIFPKVLEVVKQLVVNGWTEAYAEHPYIKAEKEGYSIDFVPCFEMDESGTLLSATDRTPLHTDYVKEHFTGEMKDDVLLLKRFMHGIGCYGAEVKIGGFSGYLCELLLVRYGTFLKVIEAAGEWRPPMVIDFSGSWEKKGEQFQKLFGTSALVVIDPVDLERNVASAVAESKLWLFVAASRRFMESPCLDFFFPPTVLCLDEESLRNSIEHLGLNFVFLVLSLKKRYVPDVLWGQLKKAESSLKRLLERNDFKVIRTKAWSDEDSYHVLLFELESATLSRTRLHMGPPVEMHSMSDKFLIKHVGSEKVVSGPWIEGKRWWAEAIRETSDARTLLETRLREDGGVSVGVPKGLAANLVSFTILIDDEIMEIYRGRKEFAVSLTEFLKGKPGWL